MTQIGMHDLHDYQILHMRVRTVFKDEDECRQLSVNDYDSCDCLPSPQLSQCLVEGRSSISGVTEATRSCNSDRYGTCRCSLEPQTYAPPWTTGSCHLTNGQHETSYVYNSCSDAETGSLCASVVYIPMHVIANHIYYIMKINHTILLFSCTLEGLGTRLGSW